jgi:hypothetical protein
MFYFVLWIYTLALIGIWWFFFVAKIHAYKFKNFSPHILQVTFWLTVSLIVMSILGYLLIFNIKWKLDNFSIWNSSSNNNPLIEIDNDFSDNSDVIDYESY